jgi:hypothetical protein
VTPSDQSACTIADSGESSTLTRSHQQGDQSLLSEVDSDQPRVRRRDHQDGGEVNNAAEWCRL